jgi:hypothetical protein
MRASLSLFPALLAIAAAQTQLSGLPVPQETLTQDPPATATATVSGPIATASACRQVARIVNNANEAALSVEAEVRGLLVRGS